MSKTVSCDFGIKHLSQQEEERRLRDEHVTYLQQEAAVARQQQQQLLLKEEEAKRRVARQLKDKRSQLQRQLVNLIFIQNGEKIL